jgi:hypothetical protein
MEDLTMRKLIILSIAVLFLVAFSAPVMAGNSNFEGPGYYQKINGKNAGEIKYFKGKGHPSDSSEWVFLGDGPGPGPCDECGDTPNFFNGDASQFSGINVEWGNLKFDDENMYKKGSGAMAYGQEQSSASYYGSGNGLGIALAFGGTFMYGGEFTDLLGGEAYGVVGATGNIAAAGVYADGPGCATIEGSGEMGTFAAVKNGGTLAAASSNGSFNYSASTPSGIVVGGGLTGGGSGAGIGTNHAWAAAGQITISGAGNLCGGECGGYGQP